MWHVCIQLLPKTVPPVRLNHRNKKSPPCRLTERGAIPYNKSREYTATCGLGPVKKLFHHETVTGLGGGFTF